jgi:transposase
LSPISKYKGCRGNPGIPYISTAKKETTMEFSEGFKKSMVEKILTPGGKGVSELSKEIGVCNQTLYNWRDKFANNEILSKSPRKWAMKDKYTAVMEAAGLSSEELGTWLRKTGLHSEHLDIWKKEIEQMISSPKDKEEIRSLKAKNKQLEKELHRKEKALAETAALLALKKKAAAIWGEEEE